MAEKSNTPEQPEKTEKKADFVVDPLSDKDLEDVSGGLLGDCADGFAGACCDGFAE